MGHRAFSARRTAAVVLSAAVLSFACASVQSSAYKSLGTVVITVDGAMKAYGDLVKAGQVPADKQRKVAAVYEQYQAAVKKVADAYGRWLIAGKPTDLWAIVEAEAGAALPFAVSVQDALK